MRPLCLVARAVSLAVFVLSLFAFERSAVAYTWMIRHGYTGCLPCHSDPSGFGPLTAYGRAQSDLLLRMPYGPMPEEATSAAGLLWGAVSLPDEVRVGGDFRDGYLVSEVENAPSTKRNILMRADLYGDVKIWRFRVAGSVGYASTGALGAAITQAPTENLISREHWVGFEIDDEGAWLARVGRLNLPFGLRNVEHALWVRSVTRTDLLDDGQHGLALSFSKDWIRGEAMAILGNYQLYPDDYRERGYSAYVEVAPMSNLAVGASSLFTRARRDIHFRVTDYRQAHGLFLRYSPIDPIVIMAEGDWVYQSLTWKGHRGGFALMGQADLEPVRGLHLMLTGEAKNDGEVDEPNSYAWWVSAVWFFAPHADVRFDNIFQQFGTTAGKVDALSTLVQLHVFL